MRIALGALIVLSLIACKREPSAEEINNHYALEHDRAQVENDRLAVRKAELDEEISRLKGRRVDHTALLKAREALEGDEAVVRAEQLKPR